MYNHLVPKSAVQLSVFFWGVACFLPVGMAYLAALALITALCVDNVRIRGDFKNRWRQVKEHPVAWPLCFFVVWTVFIFCVRPHFAETPSNLFHGLRIALTIVLVLLLRPSELLTALFGWIAGAILALVIIYLNIGLALPRIPGLVNLVEMKGNKSISIAVTLAIFAACSCLYAVKNYGHAWKRFAVLSVFLVVPVLIWFLPSRTSLILIAVCLLVGLIHHDWQRPIKLAWGIVALVVISFGVSQTPQVDKRFAEGFSAVHIPNKSEGLANADLQQTSWGQRTLLYTHTLSMVKDAPALGWGIGSWNDQWRARAPAAAHALNMPHNDFLWMGAQAGVPGMLALLAIIVSLFVRVVRIQSIAATCSVIASTGLVVAMSFNSALRDAQIGMSVLFVVVALNAWALAGQNSDSA